jgi:NADPH:quinone reductase-like Zn-dependent oxidoreductase
MIEILQVPKGEYVIQSAAASVFGRMFIQLAKHKGIKTINLVRRDSQIEELKAIGADEVINYTKEDVVDRVKQLTGGKLAYAGIDCVCGDMTQVSTCPLFSSSSSNFICCEIF